jgi:hypothetical protein
MDKCAFRGEEDQTNSQAKSCPSRRACGSQTRNSCNSEHLSQLEL